MQEQSLSFKTLIWLPGLLLGIALLCLYIYLDNHATWAARVAKLSAAFFLLMPAVYLLVKRELTIVYVNFLTRSLIRSSRNPEAALSQRDWLPENATFSQLKIAEKVLVCAVALIGVVLGGYLLISVIGEILLN